MKIFGGGREGGGSTGARSGMKRSPRTRTSLDVMVAMGLVHGAALASHFSPLLLGPCPAMDRWSWPNLMWCYGDVLGRWLYLAERLRNRKVREDDRISL